MQDLELLQEGLGLMALGMGFVFVFLGILVFSLTLMSGVIRRFQPAPAPVISNGNTKRPSQSTAKDDETLAVISAAVHRYRTKIRR
ncbi:OadG family protein [Halomonas sp. HL-93]|uniref:OadG family protein n=1 Tax=Halomonas sp. HL-93 TaxID=1666906 RepID=UPI0006DAB91A|nr:OadG family protein [Halomonas sp. HL-93]KPQ29530.1 MAG: sodium pump decarboxylase, gamma subunit [Halomonas sp. HL-93]SBR50959.1 oxaloacetate decarboxylase, gamma subunit [Halomonas sp. HL-93]